MNCFAMDALSEYMLRYMKSTMHIRIRRKKVTLCLDMQETTKVSELKKMIEAILKIKLEDQQLFLMSLNNHDMDEYKELAASAVALSAYGMNSMTASVVHPAILGLAVRQEDGSFENLEITPYSRLDWLNFMPECPPDNDVKKLKEYHEATLNYHTRYAKILEALTMARSEDEVAQDS